jgi:hypothetical protein
MSFARFGPSIAALAALGALSSCSGSDNGGSGGAGGSSGSGGAAGSGGASVFEPQCSTDGWCWSNPCAGPDDAWAVSGRSILRWDGATWTEAQTTTGGSLEAITVDGAGHVWAVGSLGRVEHYDGATWSHLDSGADDTLTALWSDSTTVVTGGNASIVLRYDL